jgi:ribonuclease P protein component
MPARSSRTPHSQKFPRASRLLRHTAFRQVYDAGQRHFGRHLTFFYVISSGDDGARVGFTVGRALGGSVVRNRIRRRVREVVRRNLAELDLRLKQSGMQAEIAINPKKSSLEAPHETLVAEVAKAFEVIAAGVTRPKD